MHIHTTYTHTRWKTSTNCELKEQKKKQNFFFLLFFSFVDIKKRSKNSQNNWEFLINYWIFFNVTQHGQQSAREVEREKRREVKKKPHKIFAQMVYTVERRRMGFIDLEGAVMYAQKQPKIQCRLPFKRLNLC